MRRFLLGARASRPQQSDAREDTEDELNDRQVRSAGSQLLPPLSRGIGWRSRGYLPHFDRPGLLQMITFRLADALPLDKAEEIRRDPKRGTDASRRRGLEAAMDAGHGDCHLRNARLAQTVEASLQHFDGIKYRLLAWVVMPNHVHVLIETVSGFPLPMIIQGWKSFTAKEGNRLLGLTGRLWQPEYFDRVIRDETHWMSAVEYIHQNPVKAGLVKSAEEWPFSSAAQEYRLPGAGETPALPAGESIEG